MKNRTIVGLLLATSLVCLVVFGLEVGTLANANRIALLGIASAGLGTGLMGYFRFPKAGIFLGGGMFLLWSLVVFG